MYNLAVPNSLDLVFVEDDPNDAQFFERALRKWNPDCKFRRCVDGQEAVDYIESVASTNDPLPKLLVLDIKLPKLLGFDVLKETRRQLLTQFLPVVMFSSSTQQEDINRAYRLGANGYINKPSTMQELNATVATLMNFWVGANRSAVVEN